MKICHIVWNLIRGGTEGQCARVAMELARRGHEQQVLVFRREGFFLEPVEAACGPVRDIGIRGMLKPATFAAVMRWARELKEGGTRIIHAWDADAAIFGQFISARAGIPLITSRRDLGEIYPPYKLRLMRRADMKAQAVVANADAIVQAFAAQGIPREKFRVIPNILDLDEFDRQAAQPFPRRTELPPGRRVVMVARLDPEKDVPTFIDAAWTALNSYPDVSFVIAGDGVERPALEAMAANRGFGGRLVFLGDVTEVPSLLRECRIGVLTPSRNEGLSNTILEYMAAGLPVVATDCGGNRELVAPPDGGAIVESGDATALARALLHYLRKPEAGRAAGSLNRDRIIAGYQPASVADEFERLYWDVVKR